MKEIKKQKDILNNIFEVLSYFNVKKCVEIMEKNEMKTYEPTFAGGDEKKFVLRVRTEKEVTMDLIRMCFDSYLGLIKRPEERSWGIGTGRFEVNCYRNDEENDFEFSIKFVPISI